MEVQFSVIQKPDGEVLKELQLDWEEMEMQGLMQLT